MMSMSMIALISVTTKESIESTSVTRRIATVVRQANATATIFYGLTINSKATASGADA
jgi:hypothetical protein